MKPCGRCGRKSLALHRYPVGAGDLEICDACWEAVTGRQYVDSAGRGMPIQPATTAGSLAAMRERKAKLEANRLARADEAEERAKRRLAAWEGRPR